MLVRRDKTAAKSEAEPTTSQLTSSIRAVVPIAAIAVWQKVFKALMPAAFQKSALVISFLILSMTFSSLVGFFFFGLVDLKISDIQKFIYLLEIFFLGSADLRDVVLDSISQ